MLRWSNGDPVSTPASGDDVNFALEPGCPLCLTPGRWTRKGAFLLIDCESCGQFAVERNAPFPTPLEGDALRVARIELQTLRGLGGPANRPLLRP